MNKNIQLSKNFSIPAVDYANQGNSIIGIRGSGKTYAATLVGEQLLENNIPFIAFDPTGVWQYLRKGNSGHPGYPVVVAGGMAPDIELTEHNATQIVDAALKARASLVIDLKGLATMNKSQWIRIVTVCVEYLMANNLPYGLRHVFLEEAAEFVPQKIDPGGRTLYSRLEALGRMGRNFGLGYTLINQRAEEIAKSIFEISEQVIMFRQAGKNSLKSISDWLAHRGMENQTISKSLPKLEDGECWVINQKQEVRIKVQQKKTYHPNPKDNQVELPPVELTGDRLKLIEVMLQTIEKPKPSPTKKVKLPQQDLNEIKMLRDERDHALLLLNASEKELAFYRALVYDISRFNQEVSLKLTQFDTGRKTTDDGNKLPESGKKLTSFGNKIPKSETLNKCAREILSFLYQYSDRSFSKVQVGVATGYSPTSGGFNNALSQLNTAGFIIREGRISVNNAVINSIQSVIGPVERKEYDYTSFMSKLSKCEKEIYGMLLNNANQKYTKEEIAAETPTNYSPTSGGFNNALSRLNTLELIKREKGQIFINPELIQID